MPAYLNSFAKSVYATAQNADAETSSIVLSGDQLEQPQVSSDDDFSGVSK